MPASGDDLYVPSTDDERTVADGICAIVTPPRKTASPRPSNTEDHYDPERTKKIYAPKSRELQALVKRLWDR